MNVRINGKYEIRCAPESSSIAAGMNLKTQVTVSDENFLLGKKKISCPKLFLKAENSGFISINGRKFTGGILLVKNDSSHFAAVNYTDIEDYIKGVLYHEVSHYWPMETLKAQAIVCRSFALSQRLQNAGRDFDLTNDIYSQVYGGKTSERYRTSLAVDDTNGLALFYNGNILQAYYHSTCGGYTENAATLWNVNIAPLSGVRCGFCRDSPHFSWQAIISLEQAVKKLKQAGFAVEEIKDIRAQDRDKSGRAASVMINAAGKEIKIPAKDFRNALNPNIIRSTNFTLKIQDTDIVFTGTGWGHGVGMCQWGAYFMGKQGYTCEQILNYYYPGASVLPVKR